MRNSGTMCRPVDDNPDLVFTTEKSPNCSYNKELNHGDRVALMITVDLRVINVSVVQNDLR